MTSNSITVRADETVNNLTREIREKLEESLTAANDPTATRYTHEEIFAPLREKYGYSI